MVHTALAIPKNTGDDVEENPCPTMIDIIDPTSQGNEAIFGVNARKQCVAMSHTAMLYHQILNNYSSSPNGL